MKEDLTNIPHSKEWWIAQRSDLFTIIFEPSDWVEFRGISNHGEKTQRLWIQAGANMSDVRAQLDRWSDANCSIYFGANPRKASGGSKAIDIKMARCHFVNIGHITWDEISAYITDVLPMPTAVVNSGKGVELWWRLPQIITNMKHWREQQKALIKIVGTALDHVNIDEECKIHEGIHDLPRVMCAPGWCNDHGQWALLEFRGEPVDFWPHLDHAAIVKARIKNEAAQKEARLKAEHEKKIRISIVFALCVELELEFTARTYANVKPLLRNRGEGMHWPDLWDLLTLYESTKLDTKKVSSAARYMMGLTNLERRTALRLMKNWKETRKARKD